MREIVGFVMGAAAGAAGALFATSTEGRALIERLREEARPEVDRAATEWEPVLKEVARAVRLAAREVETATADLRTRIGEIAAALPDDDLAAAPAGDDLVAVSTAAAPVELGTRTAGKGGVGPRAVEAPVEASARDDANPTLDAGASGIDPQPGA